MPVHDGWWWMFSGLGKIDELCEQAWEWNGWVGTANGSLHSYVCSAVSKFQISILSSSVKVCIFRMRYRLPDGIQNWHSIWSVVRRYQRTTVVMVVIYCLQLMPEEPRHWTCSWQIDVELFEWHLCRKSLPLKDTEFCSLLPNKTQSELIRLLDFFDK